MASITAATAVYTLSIPGLFGYPQSLQGFAADDMFSTDALASAETLMGADGVLSGGFVYVEVKQNIRLQADSASNALFDQWWNAQQQIQDTYTANGVVWIKANGAKWAMTKGFLTKYKPMPDLKKLLQPRDYEITWQSISPASI